MYLGFDIGGTKCAVCVGTSEGKIIDRRAFATEEPRGPDHAIESLFTHASELIKKHRFTPIAVGISCGSPMHPEAGIIQAPANLPSWVSRRRTRLICQTWVT